MACYKFTLNGQEFVIANQNVSEDTAATWQDFLRTLAAMKTNNPIQYNEFCKAVLEHEAKSSTAGPSLTRHNNYEIATCIAENLKQYGVQMEIYDDTEWVEFCTANNLNPEAQALVFNESIHVRKKGFQVQDAMHELAHLLMAYIRISDFKRYQQLLQRLEQSEYFKALMKEVKNVPGYTGLNLEIAEEALVRFIESWFGGTLSDNLPQISQNEMSELSSIISNAFEQPIINMFGLDPSQFSGTMEFFTTLLADIPAKFGASIFKIPGIQKTAFTLRRDEIRKRIQTKALIDSLLEDKILEQTKCVP